MKNRDRAINILNFKHADRMPAVHFGYWNELLYEWADQGKIPRRLAEEWYDGGPADMELDKIIGWDFNWYHTANANNGLFPQFERKVIEVLPDGTKRIIDGYGLIQRVKPGVVSIPSEDSYLLQDRKAFEELYLPKMQFSEERIDRNYWEHFNENVYDKTDVPIGLHLGSVMGDIRNMCSVIGMSYLMYDEDETLFADIVDTYADMQYKCAEAVLATGAKFDFAHYWEDICFNGGPLLSPEIFDEICAKHYKKRTDLCHRYGIDLISLDCDGVTEKLLPTWFENGVNIMFPIEIGTWGDQFEAARVKFGKGMRGVGGMDKTVFRNDKEAVDRELKRLRHLVSLGGFLPCPDHRLMPGSDLDLVKYYADEIKKIPLYE